MGTKSTNVTAWAATGRTCGLSCDCAHDDEPPAVVTLTPKPRAVVLPSFRVAPGRPARANAADAMLDRQADAFDAPWCY